MFIKYKKNYKFFYKVNTYFNKTQKIINKNKSLDNIMNQLIII